MVSGLVDAVYAVSGGVAAWISDFNGKLATLQANPLATAPVSTAIAGTSGVVFVQLGTYLGPELCCLVGVVVGRLRKDLPLK